MARVDVNILIYGCTCPFVLQDGMPILLSGLDQRKVYDLLCVLEDRVKGAFFLTSTVLIKSDRTVIVDPGPSISRRCLLARLEDYGLNPEMVDVVVNTHLHPDHIENNPLFRGKELIVHRRELSFTVDWAKRNEWPEYIDAYVNIMRVNEVEGEEEIARGVWVMETPGHTPGSISVVVETSEGRIVITGDIVSIACEKAILAKVPRPDLVSRVYDYDAAVESIQRIIGLKPAVIIPGHDKPLKLNLKG